MADVMVSYARPDLPHAETLARRLMVDGFDVWFDREIPPGQDFDRVIDSALRAARAVVVLWSRNSVGSRWVVSEAAEAASKGKLVPARLDDAVVPLEFRRVQTADLIGWNGQPDHPGYRSLVASLRSGPASVVMTTGEVMPPARVRRRRSHPLMWLLGMAAFVIGGIALLNRPGPDPDNGGNGNGSTESTTEPTTESLSDLQILSATVVGVVDQSCDGSGTCLVVEVANYGDVDAYGLEDGCWTESFVETSGLVYAWPFTLGGDVPAGDMVTFSSPFDTGEDGIGPYLPAEFELQCQVDAANQIAESNEDNNTYSTTVFVG